MGTLKALSGGFLVLFIFSFSAVVSAEIDLTGRWEIKGQNTSAAVYGEGEAFFHPSLTEPGKFVGHANETADLRGNIVKRQYAVSAIVEGRKVRLNYFRTLSDGTEINFTMKLKIKSNDVLEGIGIYNGRSFWKTFTRASQMQTKEAHPPHAQ